MPDSTPDATKRERIVGDIMSHPVVTARPAETVAEAATRMRERKVGSVVVDRRRRATDRHPHRARPGPPRGRRRRRVDGEGVASG